MLAKPLPTTSTVLDRRDLLRGKESHPAETAAELRVFLSALA